MINNMGVRQLLICYCMLLYVLIFKISPTNAQP